MIFLSKRLDKMKGVRNEFCIARDDFIFFRLLLHRSFKEDSRQKSIAFSRVSNIFGFWNAVEK